MAEPKAPNLDAMSIPDLRALIETAESKIIEKTDAAKAALLSEMTQRLDELGLTIEGLLGEQRRSSGPRKASGGTAGKKVVVKFRGPNGEEWSGRGRTPTWITSAKGKTKEDFSV